MPLPISLKVLGPIAVTRADTPAVIPLMTQPRRLAVLAYLVLARPRGLHSRDTLVALLWPDADQAGGRHALRNVLHAMRQSLGPDALAVAGDSLVGVNFDDIVCDALELEKDLASGRIDEALARYHGELLHGFHVSGAPEFERWVDSERRRLSDAVLAAAWSEADASWAAGREEDALRMARRAAALAPDDEILLRRFINFLDAAGDRHGAVRAYDEFEARLKADYDAEPSAETQALALTLRESRPRNGTEFSREKAAPAPIEKIVRAASAPRNESITEIPSPSRTATGAPPRVRRKILLPAFVALAAVLLIAFAVVGARSNEPSKNVAPRPAKLVVLPMENQTGDTTLDYIGTGVAEGIAQRLEGIGGLTVRSGARSDWPAATRHDFNEIGRQFGPVVLLKTALLKTTDSLEVRTSVLDLATSRERVLTARRFTTSGMRDMESDLAASVAGTVFGVSVRPYADSSARVDPESYRLMIAGWHELLVRRSVVPAKNLFLASIRADPSNARGWSGLASAWVAGGGGNIVGEGLDEAEAAARRALALDSTDGSALASLGMARAFRYRNVADGVEWLNKAVVAEPSNPEVFFVLGVVYRHAWMWDKAIDEMRIAERLDPLSPFYVAREAGVEVCAGRLERGLAAFRRANAISATDTTTLLGMVRVLAQLGRYDEAIAEWKQEAAVTKDSSLGALLSRSAGREGYMKAKHYDGAHRLAKLLAKGAASRVKLMQARIAAGDSAGGFEDLDALVREHSIALYRLPCLPDLDEVRSTPRFREVVRKVGPLPQR